MATDPRLSLDEKRRLAQRERAIRTNSPAEAAQALVDIGRDQGAVGLGRTVGSYLGRAGRAAVGASTRAGNAVLFGGDGPQAVEAEDAPVPANRGPRPQDLSVPGPEQAHAETIRRNPGQFGLTRIFKTRDANGNSVYSNVGAPPPGAEVRYYNQYGNREGMDPTGTRLVRDPAASDENLLIAAGHGRASLDFARRGQLARAELEQQQVLDALPPEQRAALVREQISQGAQDRRANLDRGLRRDVAAANIKRADRLADATIGNIAFNQDKTERELLRTNPGAALQETLGEISLMSPEEQTAILSDPTNPRSARAINALRGLIQQRTGKSDFDLAAVSKTGGLRRFLQNYDFDSTNNGDNFTLNDGVVVGTGVNLSDILGDPQVQSLLDAYRNAQSNNRR